MPRPPRSTHVRCRSCQAILPGWLPIPDVPDGAMLLHHLSAMHPAELTPLLTRMETEAINVVVMEAFERIEAAEVTAWLISQLDPETLRAAIDIESKDAMKARHLRSPDLADALGVTFAPQASMVAISISPAEMERIWAEAAAQQAAAGMTPEPGTGYGSRGMEFRRIWGGGSLRRRYW